MRKPGRGKDKQQLNMRVHYRILISSSGVVDVLQGDRGKNIVTQQVDDLRSFGHVLVMLIGIVAVGIIVLH